MRRLGKVERQVAERARREKLANCNCSPQDPEGIGVPLLVTDTRKFEAEMNLTCPTHGFRRLGKLIVLQLVKADRTIADESVGLAEVVDEYKRRLFDFSKSQPESEHVCEEF